jgi:hypothetical protein
VCVCVSIFFIFMYAHTRLFCSIWLFCFHFNRRGKMNEARLRWTQKKAPAAAQASECWKNIRPLFFNDVYIYFLLGIFIDHNLSRHVGWYPRHVWLPVQAKELAREAKAKVPRGPEVLLVIEKHMGTTTLNGKKHALDHEYAMISNR